MNSKYGLQKSRDHGPVIVPGQTAVQLYFTRSPREIQNPTPHGTLGARTRPERTESLEVRKAVYAVHAEFLSPMARLCGGRVPDTTRALPPAYREACRRDTRHARGAVPTVRLRRLAQLQPCTWQHSSWFYRQPRVRFPTEQKKLFYKVRVQCTHRDRAWSSDSSSI